MKVKNIEIWAAKEPLEKLLQVKLPIKVSYQIARLAKKIGDEYQPIEVSRIGLIKKYTTPDEKGSANVMNSSPEDQAKFFAEYNELMETETEVIMDKITIPAGQCDKLEIEPSILLPLDRFIVVGD